MQPRRPFSFYTKIKPTMKQLVLDFRKFIRFFTTIIASREFALVYCLLGTFTQITHTYYLSAEISSYSGWFKVFQASLLSTFISASLLYFVSIADDTAPEKEYKRNLLAINLFTFIEILINLYYYTRHLLIDSEEMRIFDFMFGSVISMLIPYTIKLYSNTIRAKEWFDAEFGTELKPLVVTENQPAYVSEYDMLEFAKNLEDNVSSVYDNKITELHERINELNELNDKHDLVELIDKKLAEYSENLKLDTNNLSLSEIQAMISNKTKELVDAFRDEIADTKNIEISRMFAKNQELFLTQFENKCKQVMNQLLISK